MAVITMPFKKPEIKSPQGGCKKSKNSLEKSRPITATLEHPLILDIKLLQRLDMTTFTKKGLIALSKFSGISLITKNCSNKKLNKGIKSIQGSNKQKENNEITQGEKIISNKCEIQKFKRKSTQPKISRFKPHVNFKIVAIETSSQEEDENNSNDVSDDGDDEEDEDSADVICKKHEKSFESEAKHVLKRKVNRQYNNKKATVDHIQTPALEIVPEPCKSCSRIKQPERLHSHPKISQRALESKKKTMDKKSSDEKVQGPQSTESGNSKKINGKGKTLCAKGLESSQKSLLSISSSEDKDSSTSGTSCKTKSDYSRSPEKDISVIETSCSAEKKSGTETKINKEHSPAKSVNDSLKYVTGCYVCGSQVPLKMRIKHEKECIQKWRSQNSIAAPEDRKPEPVRPDYRFSASGELDCEGTFDSIWENHKDSLVPCKKCGRTFFPDRIERHENCCNTLPVRMKYRN